MRHRTLIGVLVLTLVVGLAAGRPTVTAAQEPPVTPMTTPDIVPKPNSGRAPTEAGDRGGALQLLILALLAGAVGGGVLHLTRESRRARSEVGSGG